MKVFAIDARSDLLFYADDLDQSINVMTTDGLYATPIMKPTDGNTSIAKMAIDFQNK